MVKMRTTDLVLRKRVRSGSMAEAYNRRSSPSFFNFCFLDHKLNNDRCNNFKIMYRKRTTNRQRWFMSSSIRSCRKIFRFGSRAMNHTNEKNNYDIFVLVKSCKPPRKREMYLYYLYLLARKECYSGGFIG